MIERWGREAREVPLHGSSASIGESHLGCIRWGVAKLSDRVLGEGVKGHTRSLRVASLDISLYPSLSAPDSPDQDHLLLKLAIFIEFRADPTRQAFLFRSLQVHSLPVKVQHLLDLLVPRRHNILDDRHEQLRLDISKRVSQ